MHLHRCFSERYVWQIHFVFLAGEGHLYEGTAGPVSCCWTPSVYKWWMLWARFTVWEQSARGKACPDGGQPRYPPVTPRGEHGPSLEGTAHLGDAPARRAWQGLSAGGQACGRDPPCQSPVWPGRLGRTAPCCARRPSGLPRGTCWG